MAVVGELGSLTPRSCHSLDSHVRCPLASVSPTVVVPVQVWRPQEQGQGGSGLGPFFSPRRRCCWPGQRGHPAQVTSAASGLNGWDLSFQEQRGRRRQQSLALWPWAAVLQSPWVWKFCGMGWGDPVVVQVGAPAGSRPLRGRRAGQVQSACSVLG